MISAAKNSFYLFIAYIYQKGAALFYFIFLARYLGAENFGKYTFAIAFMTFFSVFMQFGLLRVLSREIARDKKKLKDYFGSIIFFHFVAGILVLGIAYFIISLTSYPHLTRVFVYLAGLMVFLDTLTMSIYRVFRGHLNLKYEALGIIIHKTVMILLGFLFMKLGMGVIWMILPLVVASLAYFINAVYFLKKKIGIWPLPKPNKKILKKILKIALPFFLAAIFGKVFATTDSMILSFLGGDKYVGWYMSAQKIIIAFLLLVAGSINGAIYPTFSYWFVRSREKLKKIFHKGFFYLLFLGVPLVFGIVILSKQIISLIYGQGYIEARPAMIILACSLPFMFLDYILASFLNACDKQKTNTTIRGIGAFFFILLNIFLVPKFFHIGTAVSLLVSFVFLVIVEIYFIKKIISIKAKFLVEQFFFILVASLGMGLVVYLIRSKVHLAFSVLTGILVYGSLSYLMDLITKQDMTFLKKAFKFKKK